MDRRQASTYFTAQGIAGLAWWAVLYGSPSARGWFVADAGWPVARSLVLADVVGFGIGSLAAGIAIRQDRSWAGSAAVAVSAVTGYATLVAAAWIFDPVDRVAPLCTMAVALVGTALASRAVIRP